MRFLNPELQARLETGATTLCTCWRLARADGLVLGFTDHDEAVDLDGLPCTPGAGMGAQAQETALGLSLDSTGIEGVLQAEAITGADVALGRWDGAAVERWLVDWTAPQLRHCTFRGTLGEIERAGEAFRAEVLGVAAALNRPVGRVIQTGCDARLGDARCGVDLAAPGLAGAGAVLEAEGAAVRVTGLDAFAAGWFDAGVLRWTDGPRAGLAVAVVGHRAAGGAVWLDLAAPGAPGAAFTVTAGCDGRAETCAARFGNILNFRGFPHLPGEDWALAPWPAAGAVHDGGPRR